MTTKKGKFSEFCERVRKWQEKPFDYEFTSNEEQHCVNCGHTFKGNYCPYCSQKAGDGHIGWKSVRQSVLDVWGLGSRSMPSTIWQLLFRPGHLISDYINGKRQVSFPPVKMLFIVSVIAVFWTYYLMPSLMGDKFDVYAGTTKMMSGLDTWIRDHFVWTYFILAILYVLPTWLMFRYSPRNPRHTLPQGFFIQIFILSINIVISFIILSPLDYFGHKIYYGISYTLLLVFYVFVYRQLFGFGVWGSLWRILYIFFLAGLIGGALLLAMFPVDTTTIGVPEQQQLSKEQGVIASKIYFVLAVISILIGWGINMIATRKLRRTLASNKRK